MISDNKSGRRLFGMPLQQIPVNNDFIILLGTPSEGAIDMLLGMEFDDYTNLKLESFLAETLRSEYGISSLNAETYAKATICNMRREDLVLYIKEIKRKVKGKVVFQTDDYAIAILMKTACNGRIYRIAIEDEDATIPLCDSHYTKTIRSID